MGAFLLASNANDLTTGGQIVPGIPYFFTRWCLRRIQYDISIKRRLAIYRIYCRRWHAYHAGVICTLPRSHLFSRL